MMVELAKIPYGQIFAAANFLAQKLQQLRQQPEAKDATPTP